MSRKLNVRLLLWTLASLAILCTCAHLLHGYQVRSNAGSLLRQARRAVEQGHFSHAVTYFNHYLAYEPNDLEALAGHALALDKLPEERFQAFLALERVLRRSPERHDVRRRAVEAAMDLDNWPEAIGHLEVLIAAFLKEGELEFELGRCQEARGDATAAAAALARAIQKAPAHLDSYRGLAELLQRQNKLEDVAALMGELIKANPRSSRALLIRARYHRDRGAADEAAADLTRAAELAPEDADVLLAVADMEKVRGQVDRARQALERGAERHPRDERMYVALAALELQQGRAPEAVVCLRRGLKALPTSGELLALLADLLIEDGQGAEAAKLSDSLRKAHPASPLPSYLQARALRRRGLAAEAGDLLEVVRATPGLTPAWAARVEVALTRCSAEAGDRERRLAAARQAVRLDPGLASARAALGSALLDVGAVDEALRELRPAAELPAPPQEVWPLLARALMLRNAALPEAERKWGEVEAALERAERGAPDSPRLVVLRAEVLAARGRVGAAADLLWRARAREPRQGLFWVALADLALLQGEVAAAGEILTEALAKVGNSLELRLARLRHALALTGPEARQALERLAREPADQLTRVERQRLFNPLAQALLTAGEGTEATRLWERLARENPRDMRSRVMLLDLALQAGRDEETRAAVADVRRLEGPNGILWRAGEAGRLIRRAERGDRAGLADARKLLVEIKERHPEWGRMALLEAIADEVEGKQAQAIEHYLVAVKWGERQPAALARLARLLQQRRELVDAAHVIRLLEEQGPLAREVARLGADIALAQGETGRAVALARQVVSTESRDYRDHLWLARILAADGKKREAETVLRGAVAISSRIPDVWVALVQHLARSGKTKDAEAAAEEARRQLPADRLPLALARCHEALGRPDQAEELYRQALAVRPTDFVALRAIADFHLRAEEFRQAEPFLRKLVDPAAGVPEEYVAWARRQLAVSLAATAGSGAFDEARTLLDRNVQGGSRDTQDERARAFVLAKNPARRDEALRLLEQEVKKPPLSPEDRVLLAWAYEAAGDLLQARDLLRGVVAAQGDNPQFLAHHIRALLRQRQLDKAASALRRLENLEPHSRRTRELQASFRKAR